MPKFQPKIVLTCESTEFNAKPKFTKLDNGQIEFDARLQTAGEINRNTNEYPKDVLAQALNSPRIIDMVNRHAWYGEHSHPYEKKDFNRATDIFPKCISHRICQIPYFKGDGVYSTIRTVKPCGDMLVNWIVDEGCDIGFSMRGLTPYSYTVESPVKHKVIKAPMCIITYDAVFFPSHPDALITTESGRVTMAAQESTYLLNELTKYFTEESSTYKLFKEELGIELNTAAGIKKLNDTTVVGTLKDGRLAAMAVEDALMKDIARYL